MECSVCHVRTTLLLTSHTPVYLTVRQLNDLIHYSPQLTLKLGKRFSCCSRQLAFHRFHHHLQVWFSAKVLRLGVWEVIVGMEGEVKCLAQVEKSCDADRVTHVWLRRRANCARATWHSDIHRRMGTPDDRISEWGSIGLRGGQSLHTNWRARLTILVADLLSNLLLCFGHLTRIALHSAGGSKLKQKTPSIASTICML